ncbi:lactococcin 972 family bacteriocin [Ligilactobacillus ruminis]|uniref:lactococcin 972 family bacteriocin n=1 Tax=Ligilactobacillus ruminis TaxID=1623 RepID=UPI0009BB60C3|nr:lactococcin 972 family bacteriocin [Lactobacillus sp.]
MDGGKWLFGIYGTKVQSTYVHYGRTHSATDKNGMGAGTRVKVHAGITAFSQVNATMRNNKAYYNVY